MVTREADPGSLEQRGDEVEVVRDEVDDLVEEVNHSPEILGSDHSPQVTAVTAHREPTGSPKTLPAMHKPPA